MIFIKKGALPPDILFNLKKQKDLTMPNSFIDRRTEIYNQRNQNKVTLSLRLSIKDDLILQELADAWETTRQDIINDLIQEFIIQDWENKRMIDKQKDEEFDNSTTTRYFLLNTKKKSVGLKKETMYSYTPPDKELLHMVKQQES